MRGGLVSVMTAFALAGAACASDTSAAPSATTSTLTSTPTTRPSATPGPTLSSPPGPAEGSAVTSEPVRRDEAARLLADGVRGLRATGCIDVRYRLNVARVAVLDLAVRTGLAGPGWWRGAGGVPSELAAAAGVNVDGGAETVQLDVRGPSSGGVFLQVADWSAPLTGCWLRMGPQETPLGFLAMTAHRPAYVDLVSSLEAKGFSPGSPGGSAVEATIPLSSAVSLLTARVAGLLDLPATGVRGARVDVTAYAGDGLLTKVLVLGPDILDAVRAAGVTPGDQAVEVLSTTGVDLSYAVGPRDADPVEAPRTELVVERPGAVERGCG